MTTPRVIEIPRRLEATSRDTFLGEAAARPLADVVPLHSREAFGGPRRPRPRRGGPPQGPLPGGSGMPGGDAA